MREVFANTTYAKLFSAQVIALLGTGLLTLALSLLAFDLAGGNAGVVMGTALTIKMVAYVAVSPVMAALTSRVPRKVLLVTADLVRAAVALALVLVTEIWQVYVLIFVLQSASATFTPAFQAVIPEVLPDERHYTRALSLSRLAYDLESLLSPMLAMALLAVLAYNELFVGTFLGFVASAVLVLGTRFPAIRPTDRAPFVERLSRGARVFWRTPQLRSLLAMNLVAAAAAAMVIVNTVVLVRGSLGQGETDVALLLGAYGMGSMTAALLIPAALDHATDRAVMLTGSALLPVGLAAAAGAIAMPRSDRQWGVLMAVWLLLGAATSLVVTPSARLLRRAATEQNRPAVFAAHFSLSHACFMVTYPTAGVLGAVIGLPMTALILAGVSIAGAFAARSLWTEGRPVRQRSRDVGEGAYPRNSG